MIKQEEIREGKSRILAVGHIINGVPENWQFDCMGLIPAITIYADGEILYAGYSIPQLELISKDFFEPLIEGGK